MHLLCQPADNNPCPKRCQQGIRVKNWINFKENANPFGKILAVDSEALVNSRLHPPIVLIVKVRVDRFRLDGGVLGRSIYFERNTMDRAPNLSQIG